MTPNMPSVLREPGLPVDHPTIPPSRPALLPDEMECWVPRRVGAQCCGEARTGDEVPSTTKAGRLRGDVTDFRLWWYRQASLTNLIAVTAKYAKYAKGGWKGCLLSRGSRISRFKTSGSFTSPAYRTASGGLA